MCTHLNSLGEAVLTSTHNLCFGAKIRKIGIPCIPQFYYIKVGFKGVYITRTCFPDGNRNSQMVIAYMKHCSMTFRFSFEVFKTLNPIQVNMKRGGPTYYYKAKRRDESRTITS